MVITQKQIADRKVTTTVFIPLSNAVELENTAKNLGISKNKLINSCIDSGLKNKDKMPIFDYNNNTLSKGDRFPATAPQRSAAPTVVEAVVATPTTTTHLEKQPRKEVEV